MAALTEFAIRLAAIKAYIEENQSLANQPAHLWAIEAMLMNLKGSLTDGITFEILQDRGHLEEIFTCSNAITSIIENLRFSTLHPVDKSNSELEAQSLVMENREEFSASQSSNYSAVELDAHMGGDSTLGNSLHRVDNVSNDIPKNLPLENSSGQVVGHPAIDNRDVHIAQNITAESASIVHNTRDTSSQYTTLSPHQLTNSGETRLVVDETPLADDIPLKDEDASCETTPSKADCSEESKPKKKKSKKKKKTASQNSTEEAAPTPLKAGYVPPAEPMPVQTQFSLAAELDSSVRAASMVIDSKTDQKVETTPDSNVIDWKPYQEDTFQRMKAQSQKVIEQLKAEHQKALVDLTKKYEAIKFENSNLKTNRNKELEKFRKENSVLCETSSGLKKEVADLRDEIESLKSTSAKERPQLPPEVITGHAEELELIIRYQCSIVAYEKDMHDQIHRGFVVDDEESSIKNKFRFETLQPPTLEDITNYRYLSEGAKKLCKIMKRIRISNAILRRRCEWYWDELGKAAETKRRVSASLRLMEYSAISFEAETFELKENIRRLEKNLNIKKPSPGARAVAREKTVMQGKVEALEFKIRVLEQELSESRRGLVSVREHRDMLFMDIATNKPRQSANIEKELHEERYKVTRLNGRVEELEGKVKVLEKERIIVEPLIEVGVAVRKRFFEHARSTIYLGQERGRANHKIIREGNDRCHRAYLHTDAALFKLFYLSGTADKDLYFDIYGTSVDRDATNYPMKVRQALDHYANIKTVQVINDSTASQNCRGEALILFNSILDFWSEHQQREVVDASEEVDCWISQLEALQEKIIHIDRDVEYRGYAEETAVSARYLCCGD
ncbi:hypothetical protein NHQ30_005597 [Ciborinia camelliae]|nr:hypothetical protein NHQ30_005597 [Ciborinia camelliae]